MKEDFESTLIREFKKLDYSLFKVILGKPHIFACGGPIDVKYSSSFRNLFMDFTAQNHTEIHDSIILAEEFKDYFEIYSDLLVFEDEIASISTVILIFLESEGSLVELGLFCSRSNYYKKLLIVAPQDKTETEDSFIYLGPLKHIKEIENKSVAVYPWPGKDIKEYDLDILIDLVTLIKDKLSSTQKEVKFSTEMTGHVAFLIYEIIRLAYPILISEIESTLAALNLDVSKTNIKKHLYLLTKLRLIAHHEYSSHKYYYPLLIDQKTINFGKDKNNKICDSNSIKMSINQSYIMKEDGQARRRKKAKQLINKKLKLEGESK